MKYSTRGRSLLALVTLPLLTLSLLGCDIWALDRHSEEGRIRADSHAFSLVPPQGWIRENTPPNLLTFKASVTGEFAANFTVGAANYNGNPPLEKFPEKMRNDLPSQFTLNEDGFIKIDEKKAYFVQSSVTMPELELVNIQYFLPSGSKMYSISFASAATEFDRYEATLRSVLGSVHVD